jgi:hypothetical protein
MIQQRSKQLSEDGPDTNPSAVHQTYYSEGSRHKVLIGDSQQDAYAALLSKNAVIDEINYASFRMLLVDEEALGGRAELDAVR